MINPPEICPACGEFVPENARACPSCGSTEETGWSEAGKADALGIPRDDFDYESFIEEEFAKEPSKAPRLRWFWWLVSIILLISFLSLAFLHH